MAAGIEGSADVAVLEEAEAIINAAMANLSPVVTDAAVNTAIPSLLFFIGGIVLVVFAYRKKVKGNTIRVIRIDAGNIELNLPSDSAASS